MASLQMQMQQRMKLFLCCVCAFSLLVLLQDVRHVLHIPELQIMYNSIVMKGMPSVRKENYLISPPPLSPEEMTFSKRLRSLNASREFLVHTSQHAPRSEIWLEDPDIVNSPSSNDYSNHLLLKSLLMTMSEPTLKCLRFYRQGGRYCQRMPDGDKKLCLDPAIAPPHTGSCIVYSFGIGFDFSFDKAMGRYGCDVFAFDDDKWHDMFSKNPHPRVYFAQIRLGKEVLSRTVTDPFENSTYEYLYKPLDNIMYILGHQKVNIHVLKMDVETDEWDLFEESIFKMDVLNRTRQLALEVHMDQFLKEDIQSSEVTDVINKYFRFFRGLRARGFELVHFEPNYIYPEGMTTVAGIRFSVLAEQLWVNTRFQLGQEPRYKHPMQYYIDKLEE